jgi:hypothetical protein
MDIKEINGILNLASVASSFEKDYSPIRLVSLSEDQESSSIVIKSLSADCRSHLHVRVSNASIKNLSGIIGGEDLELTPNVHKTFCNIANFAGVDFVVGYGEKYNDRIGEIVSSVLVRQGNNFLSLEIPFGDLVCLSIIGNVPIYVRSVIFDSFGIEFEDIKAKG